MSYNESSSTMCNNSRNARLDCMSRIHHAPTILIEYERHAAMPCSIDHCYASAYANVNANAASGSVPCSSVLFLLFFVVVVSRSFVFFCCCCCRFLSDVPIAARQWNGVSNATSSLELHCYSVCTKHITIREIMMTLKM